MKRKFATILALDVVGFSKSMSIDEDRTLINLQARRKIIDPLIELGSGLITRIGQWPRERLQT